MLMMSDRAGFFSPNAVSPKTEWHYVDRTGALSPRVPDIEDLTGKRVLVLIHGYAKDGPDTVETYHAFNDQLQHSRREKTYDQIIGYLWPGYDNPAEYYAAEGHANLVSARVRETLAKISRIASRVDVAAHSMGNRIFLESLDTLERLPNPIGHYFAMAPASDESINRNAVYYETIQECEDVHICYSENDDILQFLYPLAEMGREAFGFDGPENLSRISRNVQLVDCSEVAQGHAKYWSSPQLCHFIHSCVRGAAPRPADSRRVKLLPNNKVTVLSNKRPWCTTTLKMSVVGVLCLMAIVAASAFIRSDS